MPCESWLLKAFFEVSHNEEKVVILGLPTFRPSWKDYANFQEVKSNLLKELPSNAFVEGIMWGLLLCLWRLYSQATTTSQSKLQILLQ